MKLNLFLTLFFHLTFTEISKADDEQIFIVYMGSLSTNVQATNHVSMLQQIKGSKAANSLIYSYKRSFNGFAAKLTLEEKEKLAVMEGVISVFPNRFTKAQTTRSWDFMGFTPRSPMPKEESNVIVGMIDSGIWPEAPSFNSDNFGPPPTKWQGICQNGDNFSCNNKVIGARFYFLSGGKLLGRESLSPRDISGHGTHTASTVAGIFVQNTSFFGLGSGTARGGVPSARLAIYKACWSTGWTDIICPDADVMAAFDDAIADGVDIISASFGSTNRHNYFEDPVAIGSFHAHQNGILTAAAAGNFVPIMNFAPWLLSVAASTIDRTFFTAVQLGDGKILEGASANTFNTTEVSDLIELSCDPATLKVNSVKGKIVLCRKLDLKEFVQVEEILAGAIGAIFTRNETQKDVMTAFPFPASVLAAGDANYTARYLNSASHPTARVLRTDQREDDSAPRVASYSSRGPNPFTPNILKPDLTAPGVNILAAWPLSQSLTPIAEDQRRVWFNIDSGTSMACPHVSAIAAYIKSFRPTWSPSAITSALITTASPMSPQANLEAEHAYGAGHLNPLKSITPGLVYELESNDYIKMLCGEGYSNGALQLITGDSRTCEGNLTKMVEDLNYPSFSVYTAQKNPVSVTFNRSLTNVGIPDSKYNVSLTMPKGFSLEVEPSVLAFERLGEELHFKLVVSGNLTGNIASGALVWSDGIHEVRSPIVIH